jgi:hypothetical protein
VENKSHYLLKTKTVCRFFSTSDSREEVIGGKQEAHMFVVIAPSKYTLGRRSALADTVQTTSKKGMFCRGGAAGSRVPF